MSLFHSKEWWSHKAECPSECSPASLVVANLASDPSNADQLITGSFTGHLRIFSPSSPSKLEDLLLEVQLDEPILQVEVGRFISGSSRLALAVLFPNRVTVYQVTAVKANSGHSASAGPPSYLDLVPSYSHRFPHHAYSFTYGPFGQPSSSPTPPRDHLCILTLDGQLLFYAQDTFSFSRFLPTFLLPGPFLYARHIDSFLIATATHQLECYRYTVLGETQQGKRREEEEEGVVEGRGGREELEAEFRAVQHAKRLHVDWTANLGEPILDLAIGHTSASTSTSTSTSPPHPSTPVHRSANEAHAVHAEGQWGGEAV